MKHIGKITGCLLLSLAMAEGSHAGIRAPTAHSRANCVNNESITWYLHHSHWWRVVSFHNYDLNNPKKGYHHIDTGMSKTWRQAGVHWGESRPGGTYFVSGFHYFLHNGKEILDVTTKASNCNIYDGWWDY